MPVRNIVDAVTEFADQVEEAAKEKRRQEARERLRQVEAREQPPARRLEPPDERQERIAQAAAQARQLLERGARTIERGQEIARVGKRAAVREGLITPTPVPEATPEPGVPLAQLPPARAEQAAIERGELGGPPTGPSIVELGLVAGAWIPGGLVAAGLPALAAKFPVISAFLLEQAGEETGIIPGRPVGRATEFLSEPGKKSLEDMGVPENVAGVISELVIFGGIGRAPAGQRTAAELMTAARQLSKEDVRKTLAALKDIGVGRGGEVGAAGKVPPRKPAPDWLKPGKRVLAADRGNVGTVVSYNEETGTALVHFYNRKTNLSATLTLDAKTLSTAGRTAGRAEAAAAKTELVGAEAAARAEATSPLVGKLFRAIESANYVGARAERVAEISAKNRASAGAIETIRGEATIDTIETSLRQAKGVRKGRVAADFELGEDFTAEEISEFVHGVFTSPKLKPHEAPNAADAVRKLLGVEGPPQTLMPHEVALLTKVYPELAPVLSRLTTKDGISAWKLTMDFLNIPRAFRAAYDLSFPGRQAGMLIGRKEWWQSIKPMVRAAADKEVANESILRIVRDDFWEEVAKPAGLAIADPGTGVAAEFGLQLPFEETFISRMAGKIPGVAISQRAYTTSGNEIRWHYFKNTVKGWDGLGIKYTTGDTKSLANWINIASGWGELGPLEKVLPELGVALFSPRFWASRLEVLPYGVYTLAANPILRRAIAYDLLSFTALNVGLLSLMKYSGIPGVEVELDPRSTDWGRIVIGGKVRIDTMAGMQPVIRTAAQLIMGEGLSATGEFFPIDQPRTVGRYIQSKLSPAGTVAADFFFGHTFIGEPIGDVIRSPGKVFWEYIAPLVAGDVHDAIETNDWKSAWVTFPAVFGFGVLAYETPWQELENARDRAVQAAFGMTLEELREERGTRAANNAVALDPGVMAAEEKVEDRKAWYDGKGVQRSMKSALLPFTAEQEVADEEILDNGQWRVDQSERNQRRAGKIAGFFFANPEQRDRMQKEREEIGDPYEIPKDAKPDDIVARYLAIYTDHTDIETGSIDDYDALFDDLDRLEAKLTLQQAGWIETNLGLQKTDRQKEYTVALRVINAPRVEISGRKVGFFDLTDLLFEMAKGGDRFLSQFGSYRQLQTTILETKDPSKTFGDALNDLADWNPKLAWFLERVSGDTNLSQTDRYRRQFPEVDAYLVFWKMRGYETLLTKAAQAKWKALFGTEPPRLRTGEEG
jgi:hypothetical protein